MKVSMARRSDLEMLSRIGAEALASTYRPLLRPTTVVALLEATCSLSAMSRRWEDHPIFVARVHAELDPVGFADAFVEDARIVLAEMCVDAMSRRCGIGSSLLEQVQRLAERLPVTSDILLGNRGGEGFCEARGFVPGETLEVQFFGERAVERRWYLSPLADQPVESHGATTVV